MARINIQFNVMVNHFLAINNFNNFVNLHVPVHESETVMMPYALLLYMCPLFPKVNFIFTCQGHFIGVVTVFLHVCMFIIKLSVLSSVHRPCIN